MRSALLFLLVNASEGMPLKKPAALQVDERPSPSWWTYLQSHVTSLKTFIKCRVVACPPTVTATANSGGDEGVQELQDESLLEESSSTGFDSDFSKALSMLSTASNEEKHRVCDFDCRKRKNTPKLQKALKLMEKLDTVSVRLMDVLELTIDRYDPEAVRAMHGESLRKDSNSMPSTVSKELYGKKSEAHTHEANKSEANVASNNLQSVLSVEAILTEDDVYTSLNENGPWEGEECEELRDVLGAKNAGVLTKVSKWVMDTVKFL